ncbi:MAG: ADP-ribosylglycohydrolase family protein, partial [Kibdelosporangium sp.]
ACAAGLGGWDACMIGGGSLDLVGPSTPRALELLDGGVHRESAGQGGVTNGAAMRVTPVGLANRVGTGLTNAVVQASRVPHNPSLGIAAAAAIAAAVSAGVDGADLGTALDEAEHAADIGARQGHWVPGGEILPRIRWARQWVRGMDRATLADAIAEVIGTSVAAQESVVAAIALAQALGDEPVKALTTAAEIGGDTDTVAAMCGAIVGAQHGIAGLPGDLLDTIRDVNGLNLEPIVDDLLELR